MKRLALLIALAALAAPFGARAGSTTYTAPYQLGPKGGDVFNQFVIDQNTGEMAVLRVYPVPGAFNCGGGGGFANFAVTHAGTAATSVTVAFRDALVDPYTFVNVGVRQGDAYLASAAKQGPLLGAGTVTVALPVPTAGSITVWFGIQVTSACPNVDGGRALFSSVTIEEA